MKTVALVPVKDLQSAKSRLGSAVDADQRRTVVLDLLTRVLDALRAAPSVGDIWVVSPDTDVLAFAQEQSALPFHHVGALNPALEAARQSLPGLERLLVALADLPYLQSSDIEAMHQRLGNPRGVVIVPDVAQQGTNLMLMAPSDAIPFSYGPSSAMLHAAAARERGLPLTLQPGGRASIDIDTPADLALLRCS